MQRFGIMNARSACATGNVARALRVGNRACTAVGRVDPRESPPRTFQKALSIQPDTTIQVSQLFLRRAISPTKGNSAAPLQHGGQTLSFDADNADAAGSLAWVLATASDAEFRDGQEAINTQCNAPFESGRPRIRSLLRLLLQGTQPGRK